MAKKPASKGKKAIRRTRPPYQVFISHATADKWLATTIDEKIQSTIKSVGGTTFRDDRDINGGDDIPDRIRTAIRDSREFVVLLTPESVAREWVRLEVGAAWERKMRIVPILCHVEVDPIPQMLKSKKAILLNDFNAYLAELRQRVVEQVR